MLIIAVKIAKQEASRLIIIIARPASKDKPTNVEE